MKAAIYCRLSEEDRNKRTENDDSISIQNQKTMLLQYAMQQEWEVYRIYSDDDYTGADRNRPEFNRLLADAKERRFDIILCKTQSRFTRELELVEKYIHGLFPLWGIRFVSVVDHADTDNRGNKKSRQINGLVNEWYLEDMSENIKSVLTSRRKNGFHIGSFALYGYRKDPERKGHLLVDEEAAQVVREVFTLFSRGYGKTAIARILNDRGIPNPAEYKRQKGMRYRQPEIKQSTLWKYSAISSMLTNEIYIGNMVQGKYGSASYKTKKNIPRPQSEWYTVEGTHEPVISRELWDAVRQKNAERTKPFKSGRPGLFAGKARCANCGYTLRSSKKGEKRYLQCPNRHVAKDSCEGAFISVERLERMVREELNRLLTEYLDEDLLKAEQKNISLPCGQRSTAPMQQELHSLRERISLYQKKQEEYAESLRAVYMDRARGLLPEREAGELAQEFLAGKEHFLRLHTQAQEHLAKLQKNTTEDHGQEVSLTKQFRLECLDRETVETMVEYVNVGRRIAGSRDVPVEIHWNF